VLNDADKLAALLRQLRPWQALGDEVVVVDGGSDDASLACAACADHVVTARRGRAVQMNAGAALASGARLWFVHADTRLRHDTREALLEACSEVADWGRFNISIDDAAWPFRLIERTMNLRSAWSGIATGDQALFMHRDLFFRVGGYPPLALMEDIEVSRALKRHAAPRCLKATIATSSRRWRAGGVLRTIALMWFLRLAWFCGVSANRLARIYG